MKIIIQFLTVLFFLSLTTVTLQAQTTINYQQSIADFPNPERGFYRYSEARSGNYVVLDQQTLADYRLLHTPPTANYSIYSTLVFRYFFLEDFKTEEISPEYLANMQIDFDVARAAGVKIIPRFAYTDEVDPTGCASFICPPYGDASKDWILTHLAQLEQVLEDNKDVIATIQMGLIGVWGENYYTDFFGDASQGPDFKLTDANWNDRIEVLDEILDKTPVERMVQVRYPQMKQRIIYGIDAPTTSNATSSFEAFSTTDKARLGLHNDCLLSSGDDFGTYADYGNSSSSSISDTTNLKPYFAADSRYVAVGGETCSDDFSPENDCASTNAAAYGDIELERMHYSYLNSQYNNDVNNDWEASGCMDEIKRRLGYRFELQNGTFSDEVQPGQVATINIDLQNVGYASPYNARGVELMFRNNATSDVYFVELTDDPRFWFAENASINITESICVPAGVPPGTYELLLHLPDPMPNLYGKPDYSIRLANTLSDNIDVWEPSTGYNKLGHSITINNTATNNNCNGEIELQELLGELPVDLIRFQATANTRDIDIKWITNEELNSKGFSLERSTNNLDFAKIAWKDSNGNTDGISIYIVTDTDVSANVDYYYRLVQEDLDGTRSYSWIETARINRDKSDEIVNVYPNPTSDLLSIDFDKNKIEGDLQVTIISAFGIQIMPTFINTSDLNIADLPEGIYFLEIMVGDRRFSKKIVKN